MQIISEQNVVGQNGADTTSGIARMIEYEFSRIGSGASCPSPVIEVATADSIAFNGNVDRDTANERVTYKVQNYTGSLTAGMNPNLKLLYRRENAVLTPGGALGITLFKLSYYDAMGRPISFPIGGATLNTIRSVKVQLRVESAYKVNPKDPGETYAATYWEKIISPKNIQTGNL
jgi:hypothetical protein